MLRRSRICCIAASRARAAAVRAPRLGGQQQTRGWASGPPKGGANVPTRLNPFQVPTSVIDFQRRVLEFQRSAFTNAFELAVRLQDRRRDVLERWIDRFPSLPAESKELVQAWTEA